MNGLAILLVYLLALQYVDDRSVLDSSVYKCIYILLLYKCEWQ